MRKLGIIDHHAGNLFSLENALKILKIKYVITNKEKILNKCSFNITRSWSFFTCNEITKEE